MALLSGFDLLAQECVVGGHMVDPRVTMAPHVRTRLGDGVGLDCSCVFIVLFN